MEVAMDHRDQGLGPSLPLSSSPAAKPPHQRDHKAPRLVEPFFSRTANIDAAACSESWRVGDLLDQSGWVVGLIQPFLPTASKATNQLA